MVGSLLNDCSPPTDYYVGVGVSGPADTVGPGADYRYPAGSVGMVEAGSETGYAP